MTYEKDDRRSKPLFPLVLVLLLIACVAVLVSERTEVEQCLENTGPWPQYELGQCYAHGYGVTANPILAAKYFRLAAAQGSAKAQANLALLYAQGRGVTQSYSTAAALCRKAAGQGLGMAQNQLGILYAEGRGVPQDFEQAAYWFEKATRQGYQPAICNLRLLAAVRPPYIPELTLRNGTTLHAVTVQKVEPGSLTVSFHPHEGGVGVAKLAFKDLPATLQTKYGYSSTPSAQFAASDKLSAVSVQAL
jgi:TPR repeat protein